MLKKYTINELVIQVNSKIQNEEGISNSKDSRISEAVSLRKVRDLLTKGLISKGVKEGRSLYFDDIHVNQIIEYKKLQGQGVSERLLKSFGSEYITDSNIMKDDSLFIANSNQVISGRDFVIKPQSNSIVENSCGNAALNEILKIKENKDKVVSPSIVSSLRSSPNLEISNYSGELYKTTQKLRDLNKMSAKSFTEYPLDENGGLVLKVESNYKTKNIEEILEKIKQLIGD